MMRTDTPTQVHDRLYGIALEAVRAGKPIGWLTNLVILEQKAKASARLKVCIECDALATSYHAPESWSLIKSTGYYMCDDCEEYWKAKALIVKTISE